MKKQIDHNANLVALDKILNDLQKIGRDYLADGYPVFRELSKGMRYIVGAISTIEELNAQSVKKPSK